MCFLLYVLNIEIINITEYCFSHCFSVFHTCRSNLASLDRRELVQASKLANHFSLRRHLRLVSFMPFTYTHICALCNVVDTLTSFSVLLPARNKAKQIYVLKYPIHLISLYVFVIWLIRRHHLDPGKIHGLPSRVSGHVTFYARIYWITPKVPKDPFGHFEWWLMVNKESLKPLQTKDAMRIICLTL